MLCVCALCIWKCASARHSTSLRARVKRALQLYGLRLGELAEPNKRALREGLCVRARGQVCARVCRERIVARVEVGVEAAAVVLLVRARGARLVRRLDLAEKQRVPRNLTEEDVALDVVGGASASAEPLVGLGGEQRSDDVLRGGAHRLWEAWAVGDDVVVEIERVGALGKGGGEGEGELGGEGEGSHSGELWAARATSKGG